MMGQHYMAHRTNLVQVLLNLPMVAKVEDYYNHYIFPTPLGNIWNSLTCQDCGNRRAKIFTKCEDLMDKYFGAFETYDDKIQDTNFEDVIRQCIYCSSKVQIRPLS